MSEFAIRVDNTVMARLDGIREIFWQDLFDADSTNHRYTVRYPSRDAAKRGAVMYNGAALELPA